MGNEVSVILTLRRSSSKINSILFNDDCLFALNSVNEYHCFSRLFEETSFKHEFSTLEASFAVFHTDGLIGFDKGIANQNGAFLCEGFSKLSFLSPIIFNDYLLAPAHSDDGTLLAFNMKSKTSQRLETGKGMLLGTAASENYIFTLNDDASLKVFDAALNEICLKRLSVPGACCIAAQSVLETTEASIIIGTASGYLLYYRFDGKELGLLYKRRYEHVITKVHLNFPFALLAFTTGNTYIYNVNDFDTPLNILEYTPASVFLKINNHGIPHWNRQQVYNLASVIGCQNGIIRIVGLQ